MSGTQNLVFGSSKSKEASEPKVSTACAWSRYFSPNLCWIQSHSGAITEAGALPSHLHGKLFPMASTRPALGSALPLPTNSWWEQDHPTAHCSQECALPAHVLLRLTFHASHSLLNISMANSQETESFVASILVSTLNLKQDKECKTKTTHYCSPLSFL